MDISKWINIERFQDDNNKRSNANTHKSTIVFMGDSITEGWDRYAPDFFKNPALINRGISGQTSHQMLLRFRQDVIDLMPEKVVINCGTNDIAGNAGIYNQKETLNNIMSMCDLAKANNIKAILSSVLPSDDLGGHDNHLTSQSIINLNTAIERYAIDISAHFLNYHLKMKDKNDALKETFTYDGVHPNFEGYAVMETIIQEKLVE